MNEVRVGGSPPIKGTLHLNEFSVDAFSNNWLTLFGGYRLCTMYIVHITLDILMINWHPKWENRGQLKTAAKISFNIILLNLAVRIIAIFLLIDLFVFNSYWWMFDRYISIIDRKMFNTNEYFIDRFTSTVWKNSIVRQISIIIIEMVAPQRACRPLRDDVIE